MKLDRFEKWTLMVVGIVLLTVLGVGLADAAICEDGPQGVCCTWFPNECEWRCTNGDVVKGNCKPTPKSESVLVMRLLGDVANSQEVVATRRPIPRGGGTRQHDPEPIECSMVSLDTACDQSFAALCEVTIDQCCCITYADPPSPFRTCWPCQVVPASSMPGATEAANLDGKFRIRAWIDGEEVEYTITRTKDPAVWVSESGKRYRMVAPGKFARTKTFHERVVERLEE